MIFFVCLVFFGGFLMKTFNQGVKVQYKWSEYSKVMGSASQFIMLKLVYIKKLQKNQAKLKVCL